MGRRLQGLLIAALILLPACSTLHVVKTHGLPGGSVVTVSEYSSIPLIGMKVISVWEYDPSTGKDIPVNQFCSQPKSLADAIKGIPVAVPVP